MHLCVLSVNLRKNGDYFSVQHQVIGFITGTALIYCAVRAESLDIINPLVPEFFFKF